MNQEDNDIDGKSENELPFPSMIATEFFDYHNIDELVQHFNIITQSPLFGLVITVDGLVKEVNSTFIDLFGYDSCTQILNKSPDYFITSKSLNRVKRAIEQGERGPYTAIAKKKNDEPFHIEIMGFPVSYHGEPARLTIFNDISERESILSHNEEYLKLLKISNRELEQFAYIISHDLQEPLRMITSFMELLQEDYLKDLDSKGEKYVDYIVDGSKRMQNMIEGLLRFSRVKTRANEFTRFDLNQVIEDVKDNLMIKLNENSVTLQTSDLPTLVGDYSQFIQIFQNLISNGIKFNNNSEIFIEINSQEFESYWKFEVKDNGIGINPDYEDRIFRVFQRLHTSDEFEGTGIGLAICRRITERHGGEIWIEPNSPEGTIIYFTISKELV